MKTAVIDTNADRKAALKAAQKASTKRQSRGASGKNLPLTAWSENPPT
ncbi:hypothetical protein [Thiobacillus denitrificans]|nr:hypothetical protein [Thiobacillus denitrificans]